MSFQADFGEAVGPRVAVFGLEGHRLASRQSRGFALPFCRRPGASCSPRRKADCATPGRMALDRMAQERIRTNATSKAEAKAPPPVRSAKPGHQSRGVESPRPIRPGFGVLVWRIVLGWGLW